MTTKMLVLGALAMAITSAPRGVAAGAGPDALQHWLFGPPAQQQWVLAESGAPV